MPDPTPDPRPLWKRLLPLKWEQLVQWLVLAVAITALNRYVLVPLGVPPLPPPGPGPDVFEPRPNGWIPPTDDERQKTFQALKFPRYRLTEAGQVVAADADAPLWRLAFKARPIPVRDQGQLGSCVSFGYSAAVEYTMAAQVTIGQQRQVLPDSCQEAIYGGSRVEVNGGRVPFSGDGSTGAWGAKWLETVGGVLPRGVYGNLDLGRYDVSRCKQWGNKGVPDDLEPECKKHKAHCSLVGTTAEARSALQQGYAIAVCSNVGFDSNRDASGRPTRDARGFLKSAGSWGHCMCIIGYRSDVPGFLILNSWGADWVTGPKGFGDEPDGSFWAAEASVQRMLSEQDSYAVANADGFKKRKIAPEDWLIRSRRDLPTVALQRGIGHAFALAP